MKFMKNIARFLVLIVCVGTLSLGSLAAQAAQGKRIQKIEVRGVERIEPSTVISYMSLRVGDSFEGAAINRALKNLFATGLFADVSLKQKGQTLVVSVIENPIINEIAFEGNKRVKDEDLAREIQLRQRVVFTRTKVQTDVERVLEIYRRSGRFSATVEPKIIKLDQNRVNLVFEINEGPKTRIQKVVFIGNKKFDDDRLKGAISSKEKRWYRFLSSDDTYDPDRLAFDQELLRRFYLEQGYADFRIDSAVAELTPNREDFFLTFTIEEGERYKLGKVEVESKITELDVSQVENAVTLKDEKWYNAKKVEDTVGDLTDAVGDLQYAFVDIRPDVKRNRETRSIDVNFVINEAPRVFVERIEIGGNVRTLDEVIRREMELVEGDPYNAERLRKSEQKIQDLAFFEEAEIEAKPGSTPEQTVIDVKVSEKSTGELSIGAGFSTADGPLADLRIKERNLLGKGQELGASLVLAGERSQIDLSFTEPYFMGRDLAAGFDLFHIERDLQDESSFDLRRTGGALRVGYPLSKNLRQNLKYRLERNDIKNVQPGASTFIALQSGQRTTSAISQRLTHDTTDSKIDPTEGHIIRWDTEVAGLGGDAQFVSTKLGGTVYYPIRDQWIFSVLGEAGIITGYAGDDVQINDRFSLGGQTLRGFETGGVGPRDVTTNDSLGGNQFYRASVELAFPSGLPKELGVGLHTFVDAGTLTDVDDAGIAISDEDSLRLSAGMGVSWKSPLGPIRIDAAAPLIEEDFDVNEVVRVNFGTRF